MGFMTIGEFARRTRLSAKALRLYDDLKLVVPAQVDPNSGYRLYTADQVQPARLVGHLRRAGMPLALISTVVIMDGAEVAQALSEWSARFETTLAERRALVSYLQAHLKGKAQNMYDINVRPIPERRLLAINRHVSLGETDQFFADAFARLRAAGPGIAGIEGVPFLVFYGEVSDDSDGPIELCRPVASDIDIDVRAASDLQLRSEAAHDEAYIRLPKKDLGWPAMLPACDALEHWATDQQRRPGGPLRQLLIADQRTATAETLVCDLSLPFR